MNRTTLAAATIAIAALAGCSTTPPAPQSSGNEVPVSNAPASVSSSPKTTSPAVAASTAAAPVGSIYFDFDSTVIKDQYSNSIRAEAALLGSATKGAQLEGNADERGSREYNMALGQKRADAVKRALTALGAKPDRIETVSYGEDKPRAKGHDEAAWAENRRVDFTNK